MSFSDLVHNIEHVAEDILVPRDRPSSVEEAAAIAKAAEGVAVTVDPGLEPIFQAIGDVGNVIERAIQELGQHVGHLKATLANRAAAPVQAPPPVAAADPSLGGGGGSTEATPSEPAPASTGDASPTTPAVATSTPQPDAPTPDTPATTAPPTSEATATLAPADTALTTAEAAFEGLSPEDKAAFEATEQLQTPPAPAPTTSDPTAPPA